MDLKKALLAAIFLVFFLNNVFADEDIRPWSSFDEYNERLDHSEDMDKVNAYVYKISEFIKQKCPQEYCKHVLIVGDDFVIPMERKIIETENGPQLIYSDGIYAVTSTRNVGETRDVFENETEIVFVVPASMNTRFRQAVDNLKSSMATRYGLNPAGFEEYPDSQASCAVSSSSIFWNKSIVIIGENNTFLNCNTFWKNSPQVFEMSPSPWGHQTNPRKQALIIKTNIPEIVEDAATILDYNNTFQGSIVDSDGDGWSDKDELNAHTNPLNKHDNICTKLPGLKWLYSDMDDVTYWVDLSNRLLSGQIQSEAFGTQSILAGLASDMGKLHGMYAGITTGARDDYTFVTADVWTLAGTIVTASLNTQNQAAAMAFLDGYFTDTLATQCAAARHGVNIGDDAQKTYFMEVLPGLYKQAQNTPPVFSVILDDTDRNAFNDSYVAAYHVGYIGEQLAVGKGMDEILKSLKLGKFLKALSKTATRILGNPVFENAPEAAKGFEKIALATDEASLIKFEEQLTKKYGSTQGYERLKTISQYFQQASQNGATKETLDTASKALTKYEGAELLVKNSDDASLLARQDALIQNKKTYYGLANTKTRYYEHVGLNELGEYDEVNDLVKISTKYSDGTPIPEMHLNYLGNHEFTHAGLTKQFGNYARYNPYINASEFSKANITSFNEVLTDATAKRSLTNSSEYLAQIQKNIDKEFTSIDTYLETGYYFDLSRLKSLDLMFGNGSTATYIDSEMMALKGQAKLNAFNDLTNKIIEGAERPSLTKSEFESYMTEISSLSETLHNTPVVIP